MDTLRVHHVLKYVRFPKVPMSNDPPNPVEWLLEMDADREARFFVDLAYQMTMVVRFVGNTSEVTADDYLEVNALFHHVLRLAVTRLRDRSVTYKERDYNFFLQQMLRGTFSSELMNAHMAAIVKEAVAAERPDEDRHG